MKLSFSGICGSKPKLDKNEESRVQPEARPAQQQVHISFKADQFGPERKKQRVRQEAVDDRDFAVRIPFKADQFGSELEEQRARQEAADERDFAVLQKQIAKLNKRNKR